MRHAAILTSLSALCLSAPAIAGEVTGTVYNPDGVPAAKVAVSVPGLGLETLTGPEGGYSFADLPAGEHEIAVGLGADRVQSVAVQVAAEGAARRNIVLFSRASIDHLQKTALSYDAELAEGEIEEARRLADRMIENAREPITWQWRDGDA